MPTGYTEPVCEGKLTDLRTFTLRCARAFGAYIMMRDDDMDKLPTPNQVTENSDYCQKALAMAKQDLEEVKKLRGAHVQAKLDEEYEQALSSHLEAKNKAQEIKLRLEDMIKKVQDWHPPSKEHYGLKEFMLGQLLETVRFDGTYDTPPPKKRTPAEYMAERREYAERQISYFTKELELEKQRSQTRSTWVQKLYESFDSPQKPAKKKAKKT